MSLFLHVSACFGCVFGINGRFFETVGRLRIGGDEVIYLTVFPLNAALLPYTVKLNGGTVASNDGLARAIRLTDTDVLVRLLPRYNYVYAPESRPFPAADGTAAERFFSAVKSGDAQAARTYLTPGLSSAVDDESLRSFFAPYREIISADGVLSAQKDVYFLVTDDDRAEPFAFVTTGGLIDDIAPRNGK